MRFPAHVHARPQHNVTGHSEDSDSDSDFNPFLNPFSGLDRNPRSPMSGGSGEGGSTPPPSSGFPHSPVHVPTDSGKWAWPNAVALMTESVLDTAAVLNSFGELPGAPDLVGRGLPNASRFRAQSPSTEPALPA